MILSLKKRINVFIICFLVVFSFNFIPKNINVIQKQNYPGMAARQNVLQYSFLDAKNPFILSTETAMASVGVGELTAGGLALLEGVLMPWVLGGLGVAGFLYADTKFNQAEANIRKWAEISAEVATQLNETASKKNVGDTVTLEELPHNLVQKMTYELGKVNYDGANFIQTEFAEILKSNTDYINSTYSVSLVRDVYNIVVPSRLSARNEVVFYRFRNSTTIDFIVFNYSDVLYDSNSLSLTGVCDMITYYTTNPSNVRVSTGTTFTANTFDSSRFAPYSSLDLGRIKYRVGTTDTIPSNSVSYYPPSRTGSSDGQSISVPTSYPVTVPTDGSWTRSPDSSVPVSVPDSNVGTISVPINDVDVIPRDTTGDPDIPIPSEQTGFWSGLWEWLKAILKAILSIPGLIVTGIGNLLSALWEFLQSILDGIGSIIASLTDSVLSIDVAAVQEGIMEPFRLPRFQQTWNVIQDFDTLSVEPPKLNINLGQLFGAGTSLFISQNPFSNSDSTFIDFSLLNQYSFGGMPLISYFRFLTGVGFIWTTFNYCWRKLTPDTVI